MISVVVTILKERKVWFATKWSDDMAVLDFYNEFVSRKIDVKPSSAENQADNVFSRK